MQGGVRRKADLLPRYRGQNNGGKGKGSYLTTPMKKAIIYALLLGAVFFAVHTLVLDSKRPQPEFELEDGSNELDFGGKSSETGGLLDAAQKMALQAGQAPAQGADQQAVSKSSEMQASKPQGAPKVPKEQFNNEVAMQQEVKNLEEHEQEYQKSKTPSAKDTKQGVGNDVKADKQQASLADEEIVDEQAKKINDKAPYKKTDTSKQVENQKAGKKVGAKGAGAVAEA
ncbi:LAFA_0C06854g1_1 [Lachancea sp. 'fantastica']|nr:LAFA_0C06854g1_1 [Lachancea sp. 'fantastica']